MNALWLSFRFLFFQIYIPNQNALLVSGFRRSRHLFLQFFLFILHTCELFSTYYPKIGPNFLKSQFLKWPSQFSASGTNSSQTGGWINSCLLSYSSPRTGFAVLGESNPSRFPMPGRSRGRPLIPWTPVRQAAPVGLEQQAPWPPMAPAAPTAPSPSPGGHSCVAPCSVPNDHSSAGVVCLIWSLLALRIDCRLMPRPPLANPLS